MPEETSALRELARTAMKVGGWRWVKAVGEGEVGAGWTLGVDPGNGVREGGDGKASVQKPGAGNDGTEQTLARCWIIVYAVAGGWGQWDLVDELRTLFS